MACGEGTGRPSPEIGDDDGGCTDASFSSTIQPMLANACWQCHRLGMASGGLIVESHAHLMAGGASGAAIVPGDCDGSLLYRNAARLEQPYMPPGMPLSGEDTDCLCAWIEAGALDD